MRFVVAGALQLLCASQLFLDEREAPPEKARTVPERGHLNGYLGVRLRGTGFGDVDGEFPCARSVADEVCDVGLVVPLDRVTTGGHAPVGDSWGRRCEGGDNEPADVRECREQLGIFEGG